MENVLSLRLSREFTELPTTPNERESANYHFRLNPGALLFRLLIFLLLRRGEKGLNACRRNCILEATHINV